MDKLRRKLSFSGKSSSGKSSRAEEKKSSEQPSMPTSKNLEPVIETTGTGKDKKSYNKRHEKLKKSFSDEKVMFLETVASKEVPKEIGRAGSFEFQHKRSDSVVKEGGSELFPMSLKERDVDRSIDVDVTGESSSLDGPRFDVQVVDESLDLTGLGLMGSQNAYAIRSSEDHKERVLPSLTEASGESVDFYIGNDEVPVKVHTDKKYTVEDISESKLGTEPASSSAQIQFQSEGRSEISERPFVFDSSAPPKPDRFHSINVIEEAECPVEGPYEITSGYLSEQKLPESFAFTSELLDSEEKTVISEEDIVQKTDEEKLEEVLLTEVTSESSSLEYSSNVVSEEVVSRSGMDSSEEVGVVEKVEENRMDTISKKCLEMEDVAEAQDLKKKDDVTIESPDNGEVLQEYCGKETHNADVIDDDDDDGIPNVRQNVEFAMEEEDNGEIAILEEFSEETDQSSGDNLPVDVEAEEDCDIEQRKDSEENENSSEGVSILDEPSGILPFLEMKPGSREMLEVKPVQRPIVDSDVEDSIVKQLKDISKPARVESKGIFQIAEAPDDQSGEDRLEETVRGDTTDHDVGTSSSVSAQIREIVTKHLSTEDLTETGAAKHQWNMDALKDENRTLQHELERMEDLLATTRAEREEIGIKYSALSERLDQLLRHHRVDGSDLDDKTVRALLGQNMELRRRMEDEHRNFQKRVQTYQDGQQLQAQLVQRLQSKVIQYKQKCDNLEMAIAARQREMDESRARADNLSGRIDTVEARLSSTVSDHEEDFESDVIRLEEERQREQLEAATQANQSLASDVQKLTQDWLVMREELESKEVEWREGEQSFNEYFAEEHSRLLSLWRDATKFRREFGDMKTLTERDLYQIRADLGQAVNDLKLACVTVQQQQMPSSFHSTADQQECDYLSGGQFENVHAMSPSELWHRIQELSVSQAAALAERSELLSRFEEIKSANDQLRHKLDEKERTINSLKRSRQEMGNENVSVERQISVISSLRTENRSLYNALHDVANRMAARDVDGIDLDRDHDDRDGHSNIGLLAGLFTPMQSGQSRGDNRSEDIITVSMIDGVISTIQSALNKRHMQVEELNSKLTSTRDQYCSVNRKYEDCLEHGRQMEREIQRLKSELDSSNREKVDLNREVDHFRTKNNTLKEEKEQVERLRQSLLAQLQELNVENEKLRNEAVELQKNNETFNDETEALMLESEKQRKSIEMSQKVISTLESKLIVAKDELVATKEELDKMGIARDVVTIEKDKLEEMLGSSEKRCRNLEVEVSKLKSAEVSLRDVLTKLHTDSEMLDQEKIELNAVIKKLSDEKVTLTAEVTELEQEKTVLREEVLRLEQENMALVDDKVALQEAFADAERVQVTLRGEADRQSRDKHELSSQLATEKRHRAGLSNDIARLTRELEHRMELIEATGREKERLIKERADLAVRHETSDREVKSLSETVASLRVEKGNLEMSLYELQQAMSALDAKRMQFEVEKEGALEKTRNLQSQVAQLLKDLEAEKAKLDSVKNNMEQRLAQSERERSVAIEKARTEHQIEIGNIIKERDAAKQRWEASHEEALQKLTSEHEEEVSKQEGSLEALRRQLEVLQQDFQKKLNSAERERDSVLASLRKEKSKMQEKIQLLQKDLQTSHTLLEKEKRDALSRAEQHKTTVDDLHTQLRGLKSQMEDASMTHEKALKDLRNLVQESSQQRELAVQEGNSLRGKLQLAEDGRDSSRKELSDAVRRLREVGEEMESLRNDISELNRQLNEEKCEKNSTEKLNEELKSRLKRAESDKGELRRTLEESFQKITVMESRSVTSTNDVKQLRGMLQEVEKTRVELRKEVQRYRRQLKTLEEELSAKVQEIGDLNGRLSRNEERDESNRKEIYSLKHKLSEAEATRDAVRKELANVQHQQAESENVRSLHERDVQQTLHESQQRERQLEEHRRRLDDILRTTGAEVEELRLKLSSSDGKVGAMEAQLLTVEGAKKEAEQKLTNIYSSLRRYVGLRAEVTSGIGHVKLSPLQRKTSPKKGDGDAAVTGLLDVNTEVIRSTLRDVMQQILMLEKDKEESNLQIGNFKQKVTDLEAEKNRLGERLVQAQTSLGSMQQASHVAAAQMSGLQKTIVANQETIGHLRKEGSNMADTVASLEQKIRTLETEATQNLDKLDRLQQKGAGLEKDNIALRDALVQVESRASLADHAKRSLEGEVQRLRISITDKDTEFQVLQERCEAVNRRAQEQEEKVISLQVTIDRLNLALERSAEDEHELKDRLQTLNKSLNESTSSGWNLQEKIQQLQKMIASSENERRVLQERMDNSKQTLNESKKSNLAISERVQQLRAEISNYEDRCRDLENQMRSSEKLLSQHNENDQQNLQQIQRLQHEKHSLQNTVAELQRTLAQIEVEKQDFHRWHILLEKDKSALKQTLDKVERERLLSEELATRSSKERSSLDRSFNTLQKDSISLQHRVASLESQLSEQERCHSEKLLDLTSRHRQEKDNEMERLRNAQVQAERTLELRERAHRQRVLGLEQQVQLLRDQLNQEIRKRQLYIQQSTHAGNEMKDLRHALDESLKTVSRDGALDAVLLEHETRKLDNVVDRHLTTAATSRPTAAAAMLRGRSPLGAPPLPSGSALVSSSTRLSSKGSSRGSLQNL